MILKSVGCKNITTTTLIITTTTIIIINILFKKLKLFITDELNKILL